MNQNFMSCTQLTVTLRQVVLTEAQTAALDTACNVADTAVGEEYKFLVRETAQKLGLADGTVRDYFAKKKRLVGPELVRCRCSTSTRYT